MATKKAHKSKKGGLTEAGRRAAKRQGHNLKAPVTRAAAAKSPAAAKRRKSFCARMKGMPGPMKTKTGKPTRKALALKRWDCG